MPKLEVGKIYARITLTNATENHRFNEIAPGDEYGPWETVKEARRELAAEYGPKCTKMYRDQKEGPPKQVGWVFQSRQKYTDCDETYLREAWCELVRLREEPRQPVFETVEIGR